MRVFRHAYTTESGKSKDTVNWYVELRDGKKRVRRIPGFVDYNATEELGRKLERLVALKSARQLPDAELSRWIEELPESMRRRLARFGILDPLRLSGSIPLADLLREFEASMLARGVVEKHAKWTAQAAQRVFAGCRFKFWTDVRPLPVEGYLREERQPKPEIPERKVGDKVEQPHVPAKPGMSARTSNSILGAARAFCRWMVANGRAVEDPLRVLRPLNAKLDKRLERRALTPNELRLLLTATAAGPERWGISGLERSLLYRLAVETGLRASELQSLRVASFDLKSEPPTVTLQAAYSKRRRQDVLALRPDTTRALAGLLRGRMPTASAFSIPANWRSAEMLAEDLVAAKVAVGDKASGIADFHSLRHTFISNLTSGGVSPKIAQALARHSTIALTMDRYTHLRAEDELRALDVLPDLGLPPEKQPMRATGTDGQMQFPSLVSPLVFGSGQASSAEASHAPSKGQDGAPGWTRTTGRQIRNLLLYPPELRARRGHGRA